MLAIIMSIENNNDRAFVEEIYHLYSEKMYLIAYDILKNHHDAEDCVQETIVKIIDKIERFKQAQHQNYLKKLIVIACRNVAINKYNENKRKNKAEVSTTVYDEDDEAQTMDIPDATEDVEKIVLSEYNYRYIKQLIDQLDSKYRDVIVLKSMQFTNEEIAYMMTISVELVRKRYSRARAKILELGGDTLYGCRNA